MPPPTTASTPRPPERRPLWLRLLLWAAGLGTAAALGLAMVLAVALTLAYPNLPDVSDLAEYRPKLPLRVYSADKVLIGEFGEERRSFTAIADIPQVMKDAVAGGQLDAQCPLARVHIVGARWQVGRQEGGRHDGLRTMQSVCR